MLISRCFQFLIAAVVMLCASLRLLSLCVIALTMVLVRYFTRTCYYLRKSSRKTRFCWWLICQPLGTILCFTAVVGKKLQKPVVAVLVRRLRWSCPVLNLLIWTNLKIIPIACHLGTSIEKRQMTNVNTHLRSPSFWDRSVPGPVDLPVGYKCWLIVSELRHCSSYCM